MYTVLAGVRELILGLLIAGATLISSGMPAQAATSDNYELEFGRDRFAAGEQVALRGTVDGDVIAAGRTVAVNASIAGDVLAAGNDVRLDSPVRQDVLLAGRKITLANTIERNARIAGATVILLPDARIDGNATLAGADLELAGTVGGYLLAAGRNVYLNGPVGGDVQVTGERIELGPNARIQGDLRYRSRNELTRDASAQVGGLVERLTWPGPRKPDRGVSFAGLLIWSLGLGLLAAILLATVPAFTQGVSAAALAGFARSLLVGFIALVCIPVALVIALCTVIGIPVGLLGLLVYPVLLLLGYVSAGIALGDAALARIRPHRAQERGSRILAAVLALLALAFLALMPLLGALICLLAVLVGLGALLRQLCRAMPPPTRK